MPPVKNNHHNRRQLIKGALALGAAPLLTALPQSLSLHAAAPKLGPSFPMIIRFELGDFEITNILDTIAMRDGPYPIIGENASEAEVQALMKENLLPETRWQPGFTPTLINTGQELILFDTGNGDAGSVKRPNGGLLLSQLEAAGYKAADIDIVIITHGHGDHISGLLEGGKPAFPNARYIFGEREYDFWTTAEMNTDRLKGGAAKFKKMTEPLKEKITFISPGMQVLTGIEPVEAFGHTPGHLAFHIESNGQKLLLWADCAHHHVASLARPDWHIKFDVDKEEGVKTRKKIFDMAATEKLPVIGFHMPFPSVGFVEKRHDQGYRWIKHSYQLK
ncbi:MAG: MBL fold metallo-hydrolase [Rhodomicrobium sp.]|nr:MAG: MBL fold metallo-hydrolase [Rhodomicrobium sp.]